MLGDELQPVDRGFLAEHQLLFPSESQIIEALKTEVFEITPTIIDWKPDVRAQIGPYGETMHHPLNQLFRLYRRGFLPKLPDASYTGNEANVNIYGPKRMREVNITANPHDIFNLLVQNEAAINTGVSKKITYITKNAKKILLAGCVELPSAYKLIETLHSFGFHGVLEIRDISAASLKMVDIYNKLLRWKERYGISVLTKRFDIREMCQIEDINAYDVVIADVLGHYLNDKDFERDFPAIGAAIKPGGLLLARDIGESAFIKPEERTVGGNKATTQSEEDKSYALWLKEKFGLTVDISTIVSARVNNWPDPNHQTRYYFLPDLWQNSMAHSGHRKLELNFISDMYQQGIDPKQRYFQLFVFGRPLRKNLSKRPPAIIHDDIYDMCNPLLA